MTDDSLGVVLGTAAGRTLSARPFSPVLALGPHRSRKTTGIVVPSLLEWPGPALVASVGGDVIEQTIEARRAGGEVQIIDPADVMVDWQDRVGWSPLDFIATADDAASVARVLVESGDQRFGMNENFWFEAAMMQLTPYLYAAAKNGRTMVDVLRWVHNTDQNEVAELLESGGDQAVLEAAQSRWGASDRDKATVFYAIDACLSIWQRQRLLHASATEPRFRFDKFLNGGANTLYVCAPLGSQREYRPFVTAFLSLLFRFTYHANRGFAGSTLDLRGPVKALEDSRRGVEPLLVVLDDAGNVAPIPHLQAMVGTSASAAIQLVTVFSDVSQMRALYGEDAARSIINNHTTLLIMPGSRDTETAELVDQLIRDEDVPGLPPGRSARERVRRLPWGSALCVTGNQPPAIVTLRSSLVDAHLLALRGAENVRS